jgi:hypothetical protein
MKNFNDPPEIELVTFRNVVLCLNQLRYPLVNCTIEKEISYSCATEVSLTVFTWPVNTLCVMVDTCRFYLHVYLFKIHINTIVSSTNIHTKCCLRFRYSGKVYVFNSYPSCVPQLRPISSSKNQMCSYIPSSQVIVSRNFRWKMVVVSSKIRIVFVVFAFWKLDPYFLSKRL